MMRDFLKDTGMTQKQMADHLGVSRETVNRWCNGQVMDYHCLRILELEQEIRTLREKVKPK